MNRIIKKSLIILCLFGMTLAYTAPRGGGGSGRGGGGSGRMGGMRSGGMGRGGGGARMSGTRMGGGPRGGAVRSGGMRRGGSARTSPRVSGGGPRRGGPGRAEISRGGARRTGGRRVDGRARRDGRRDGRRHDRWRRDSRGRRGFGRHRRWGWWGPSAFWLGWPLLYPFASYYSGPSYCYVINNAPYAITIQPYGFPTMTIEAYSRAAVPCVGGLINDISYVSSNQIVIGDDSGTIFISDDSDYK